MHRTTRERVTRCDAYENVVRNFHIWKFNFESFIIRFFSIFSNWIIMQMIRCAFHKSLPLLTHRWTLNQQHLFRFFFGKTLNFFCFNIMCHSRLNIIQLLLICAMRTWWCHFGVTNCSHRKLVAVDFIYSGTMEMYSTVIVARKRRQNNKIKNRKRLVGLLSLWRWFRNSWLTLFLLNLNFYQRNWRGRLWVHSTQSHTDTRTYVQRDNHNEGSCKIAYHLNFHSRLSTPFARVHSLSFVFNLR